MFLDLREPKASQRQACGLQDRILIRSALEGLLGAPEVRFADDGILLLESLKAARPDLVVLDLKMPRLGGLDALRRLRADPALAGLRVMVFSVGDQSEETAACQGLGVRDVMRKPVDFREFTAAVRALAAAAAP